MKRIIINFDEDAKSTYFEEGTKEDLFKALLLSGTQFLSLILDGMVTIIANSEHQELILSDLFKSLAIAKEDPIVLKELGLNSEQSESEELKNILGKDLATLAKVSGDA